MVRDSDSSQIHLRLISAMVDKLMAEEYKVSADHIGYPNGKPKEINEYIPDIYATSKDGKVIIIEAETSDSLDDKHTKLQWIAFSNADEEFSVIVPKKCLENAKKLSKEWGINNIKQFWTMEI